MTIYSQVRDQLGLNNDSQGDAAFLHALLTFADANPPGGANTFVSPYEEVAHRFRNLNPHAVRKIEAMLADGVRQFAAGRP